MRVEVVRIEIRGIRKVRLQQLHRFRACVRGRPEKAPWERRGPAFRRCSQPAYAHARSRRARRQVRPCEESETPRFAHTFGIAIVDFDACAKHPFRGSALVRRDEADPAVVEAVKMTGIEQERPLELRRSRRETVGAPAAPYRSRIEGAMNPGSTASAVSSIDSASLSRPAEMHDSTNARSESGPQAPKRRAFEMASKASRNRP